MAHPRKEIRHAVVALLVAANTAAAARVTATRVDPIANTQLPAISVYTLSDLVQEDASSSKEDNHELELEVAGFVAHTEALPVDDAMDDLAEQIENAMKADPAIGGKAADCRLVGTTLEVREENGRSDPLVGVVTLTYAVTYLTDLTETEGELDDVLRAKATHKVGADGTAPVVDQFNVQQQESP